MSVRAKSLCGHVCVCVCKHFYVCVCREACLGRIAYCHCWRCENNQLLAKCRWKALIGKKQMWQRGSWNMAFLLCHLPLSFKPVRRWAAGQHWLSLFFPLQHVATLDLVTTSFKLIRSCQNVMIEVLCRLCLFLTCCLTHHILHWCVLRHVLQLRERCNVKSSERNRVVNSA